MKTKRMIVIALVLAASFVLGMTGTASFAQEETSEAQQKDTLVGLLVTPEYLDLFDFEAYLNDNIDDMIGGGEISPDDTAAYQGRIYAKRIEKERTAENGETYTTVDYEFEGLNGILIGCARIEKGEKSYVTTLNDDAITDGNFHVKSGDESESYEVTGTIYVSNAQRGEYYYNPVYMTAEGELYVLSGSGMSFSGVSSEGMVMSHKLEEETTTTFQDKTVNLKVSVEVSTENMYPPEKIVLRSYDETGALIDSQAYAPDAMPEGFTPGEDTAFIIAETYKTDNEGNEVVTREIFDEADDSIDTFRCREDGICVKNYTSLNWGE